MRQIRFSRKEAARERRNTKTWLCIACRAGCRPVPRRKHKKLEKMLVELQLRRLLKISIGQAGAASEASKS